MISSSVRIVTVTLTAAMIVGGTLIDMLGSHGSQVMRSIPWAVKQKHDGLRVLIGISRLQLHSLTDFERVAGVLLSRETLFTGEDCTIIFTISVEGLGLNRDSSSNYNFILPAGDRWRCPGPEICMLAEAFCVFPHKSPPSLVNNSILVKLFTVLNKLYSF